MFCAAQGAHKETDMRRQILTAMAAAIASPLVFADDDHHEQDNERNKRSSVTVSFGAGLNTAQPGNAANHHVLPAVIKVKVGGVINFAVAGFHQVFIYLPGKTPEQVVLPTGTPPPLFINDLDRLYYQGIAPAGGPLGTAPTTNPLNGSNRVEPVSFDKRGTYLVICNVRPHFLDGMKAWIVVSD
jgi:plastocyanin